MGIQQRIRAYHDALAADEHHRFRSWEHCYGFFRRHAPGELMGRRHEAALHLGFYLASWGMYRGSGFLLGRAYTVHLGVIDRLAEPRFRPLWEREFGAGEADPALVPTVLAAVRAVREGYLPFGRPTDTLVSKVLLGTLGCLPACDRYFVEGFENAGFTYSCLNQSFVEQVLAFCRANAAELRGEQERIGAGGARYPMMKLVDMHFWQLGSELCGGHAAAEDEPGPAPEPDR